MVTGKIERIWLKRYKLGPMDAVEKAELIAGTGLAGNADQGGKRQVTLISLERWREIEKALGAKVDFTARRANILLSGIDLEDSRDRIIRLGGCRLRIRGETRPCRRMDEAHMGLQEAMRPHWGGGAYAEVLDEGVIAVGDAAEWVEEE